jgi:hypothetical protein
MLPGLGRVCSPDAQRPYEAVGLLSGFMAVCLRGEARRAAGKSTPREKQACATPAKGTVPPRIRQAGQQQEEDPRQGIEDDDTCSNDVKGQTRGRCHAIPAGGRFPRRGGCLQDGCEQPVKLQALRVGAHLSRPARPRPAGGGRGGPPPRPPRDPGRTRAGGQWRRPLHAPGRWSARPSAGRHWPDRSCG